MKICRDCWGFFKVAVWRTANQRGASGERNGKKELKNKERWLVTVLILEMGNMEKRGGDERGVGMQSKFY